MLAPGGGGGGDTYSTYSHRRVGHNPGPRIMSAISMSIFDYLSCRPDGSDGLSEMEYAIAPDGKDRREI